MLLYKYPKRGRKGELEMLFTTKMSKEEINAKVITEHLAEELGI